MKFKFDYLLMPLTGALRFIQIIESMNFFIRLAGIIELLLVSLVRGVTCEILVFCVPFLLLS